MESALETALSNAGIASMATIERLVTQLRRQFDTSPDAASEYLIKRAWEMLLNVTLPSHKSLARIGRYLRDTTFLPETWTPSPVSGSGMFDGSTLFDGSATFDGSASGANGTFNGSATFDGSKRFDGQ